MKGKKLLSILCATALCSSVIAGCTSGEAEGESAQTDIQEEKQESEEEAAAEEPAVESGEKVTIRFATNWGPGDAKYDYFEPLFAAFTEANADKYDIAIETLSTEDYKTKIKVETASGSLPDVFTYWGGSMISDMVEAGLLLEAEDYFSTSSQVSADQFDPTSFGYYTLQDEVYGIPLESTRAGFLANRELFEEYGLEYPTTYEELIAVSEVFLENDIIPIAMASKGGQPAEFFYSELYNQFEGAAEELNNLSQTMNFATENALKTAEVLADMIDRNMFPSDTVANGDWAPCLQLYTDQKAAMTYTYPWMYEFVSDEMQECSEFISLPMLEGAQNNPEEFIGGFTLYGFVINKQAFEDPEKQEAIVALCDFLASDELSQELTKSGMIPAKDIEIDLEEQKLLLQKLITFCEGKTLTPSHYTTVPTLDAMNMLDDSLDELFIGALTPEEFVNKVQAELDK